MTALECRHVCKAFLRPKGEKPVLRGVTFKVERGEVLSVLGKPDSGKTTLLRILLNKLQADGGEVVAHGPVSVPIGARNWINGSLSADENLRVLARLYHSEADATAEYVRTFAELNTQQWRGPFKALPPRRKGLFAFAASVAMPCSVYLLDGNPTVDTPPLRERCYQALEQRIQDAALIWVARKPNVAERIATRYAVLSNGKLNPVAGRHQALRRLNSDAA